MSLIIMGENDAKDVHASRPVTWPFSISTDASKVTFSFDITTDRDDAPVWSVALKDGDYEIWSNYGTKTEVKVDTPEKGQKQLSLEIPVTGNTLTIGVKITCGAKSWGTLDDFSVTRTGP